VSTAPLDLNRILIVKLADIGDAVLATSAVAALRRAYPYAHIDVLTAGAGNAAFRLCPEVDQIILIDKHAFDDPIGLLNPVNAGKVLQVLAGLRRTRYDAIVLLHHLTTEFGATKYRWLCRIIGAPIRAGLDNGRGDFLTHRAVDYGFGAKSVFEYGLEVVSQLGGIAADAAPSIAPTDSARKRAAQLLAEHHVDGDYVVIHPSVGGYSQARNWQADRFAAVARALHQELSHRVLLVGASDAANAADIIQRSVPVTNLTGATTLAELAALLQNARLVIGSDSGVVHLAAALEVPIIAIFGPSNHEEWMPFGASVVTVGDEIVPQMNKIAVRAGIPCSPCLYTGYSLGRREGCAFRTCLERVTAQYITQIATQILTQNRTSKSTNS
jgi:ADP-heptose:LPS heptosyltransferase